MTRTIPLIAALLIAAPAFAQTPPSDPAQKSPTNQNIQPGTGGVSKAGKDGLPDSKSGPSMEAPDGTTAPAATDGSSSGTAGSDDSGVPGDAGGKSGPAAK